MLDEDNSFRKVRVDLGRAIGSTKIGTSPASFGDLATALMSSLDELKAVIQKAEDQDDPSPFKSGG